MKILIIEDELFIRAMLKTRIIRLLNEFQDVEVVSAESFYRGYHEFLEEKPDVVILDLGLEDSNADETVENITLLTDGAEVIVVSAGLTPTLVQEAYARGAQNVVDKFELNLESLREIILNAYMRKLDKA